MKFGTLVYHAPGYKTVPQYTLNSEPMALTGDNQRVLKAEAFIRGFFFLPVYILQGWPDS